MTDRMNILHRVPIGKGEVCHDRLTAMQRCTRNGIECLQEKRRSKWDSVQKRAKVPARQRSWRQVLCKMR